ncbi:hypothetical protein AAFC00_006068 [Neodothiora populina]|uniref:Uncharacterized protein n=1 Tax=Neodothiora populina TaxID=2781224 RepID=A0ABR3P6U1_9PEZI
MTDTATARVRLHITPFTPTLFPTVIAPSIRPQATNVSFHTIQTEPTKGFGYVELPSADADKLRKKLHGMVLKGAKMKIEIARPEKRKLVVVEENVTDDDEDVVGKQKRAKKTKRRDGEYPGFELPQGRSVKRGWTDNSSSNNNSNSNNIPIDDKKRKQEKSKYTSNREVLFKTNLPEAAAAILRTDARKARKVADKKEQKLREKAHQHRTPAVIHEFAKNTQYPSFLRQEPTNANHGVASEFVAGKGWVDQQGNIVEAAAVGNKREERLAAMPQNEIEIKDDDLDEFVQSKRREAAVLLAQPQAANADEAHEEEEEVAVEEPQVDEQTRARLAEFDQMFGDDSDSDEHFGDVVSGDDDEDGKEIDVVTVVQNEEEEQEGDANVDASVVGSENDDNDDSETVNELKETPAGGASPSLDDRDSSPEVETGRGHSKPAKPDVMSDIEDDNSDDSSEDASSDSDSDSDSDPASGSGPASDSDGSSSSSEDDSSSSPSDSESEDSEEAATSPQPTPRPAAVQQSTPPQQTEQQREIHPLEALYKKSKSDGTPKPAPINTSFSFGFSNDNASDTASILGEDTNEYYYNNDDDETMPQTPFANQRGRGIRSAAPTPDTAAIGKRFSFSLGNNNNNNNNNNNSTYDEEDIYEEDENETDEMAAVNYLPVGTRKSFADDDEKEEEDTAAAGAKHETPFAKWFWENRGDSNRAWKKRRREVMKVARQRENRRVTRKIV